MKKRLLGELELLVMQAVRDQGRVTVKDVCQVLGKTHKYTTIMTVLGRLFEKGELKREKIGRQYHYWIAEGGLQRHQGILKRLKEKIFGGNAVALVSYFLESDDTLSSDELEELEALIEKKKLEESS